MRKIFDTLRLKASDLIKEDPIIEIHRPESMKVDIDSVLSEKAAAREVVKDPGKDVPLTQKEIDDFLNMEIDEE